VPHAHVHLIPFSNTSQLKQEPDMSAEPDHAALAAMAEKLML
jgi:diadenosine tetraphosphate (Ap4A) HIT family hydrolase